MMESELRQHLQDLQNAINGLTRRIEALERKPDASPPKNDNPLLLPWRFDMEGVLRDICGNPIHANPRLKAILFAAVNRWADAKLVAESLYNQYDQREPIFSDAVVAAARRIITEKDAAP